MCSPRKTCALRHNFNPRSPHGERRRWCAAAARRTSISIHAPRTGSDAAAQPASPMFCSFQSTLPARGATQSALFSRRILSNFNPRSPHGERPRKFAGVQFQTADFNPRSPHGERLSFCDFSPAQAHFNPRSPHGERRRMVRAHGRSLPISIHAPRTGSDPEGIRCTQKYQNFNPRSPHGERPNCRLLCLLRHQISIHAPRTGSDGWKVFIMIMYTNFNPRSPHGERHYWYDKLQKINLFQSTLPARGATCYMGAGAMNKRISIHAPRTGSDGNVLYNGCYV